MPSVASTVDACARPAGPWPAVVRLGVFSGEDAQLVQFGGRVFKLSPAACLVLEGVTQGVDAQELALRLNASRYMSKSVTLEDARRWAERVRAQVLESTPARSRASDLWARVTLFRGEQLRRILAAGASVYASAPVFYWVLAAALVTNIAWMVAAPLPALSQHDLARAPIALLAMLAISFLHELAHAAAAHRYHSAPASIGAGLYMGVPVLYADVTGIWCLPACERIVVNLAGVHAQLVLNVALIVLASFLADPAARWIVLTVCWMNAGAAFVNLVPFAKLDGYWVIADALGSPHLERDANRVIADVVRRALGRVPTAPPASWPLAIYAVGQMAVYVMFAQWLVMAMAHSAATVYHAPTLAAGARAIVQGSPWQLALLAFVLFRLAVRVFSGGRHQPEKSDG